MTKSVVCGLGSAAAFLTAFFLLHMRFAYAAALGLGAWLVLSLILSEDTSRRAVEPMPEVEGMAGEEVRRIILEGEERVERLRAEADRISPERVAGKVEAIATVAQRMLGHVRQDPADVRSARRFLEYYLQATLLVVQRYADLSARGAGVADVQEVLSRFEGLLDTIHAAFEKQLGKLLRNDALDLDTDITVLERLLEMEGL